MKLPVRRLAPDSRLPTRAYSGDAGLDLYAAESTVIPPGGRRAVRTGIALAIPAGHVGLVAPRSGVALEHGITHVDSVGVIDSGYRGEVTLLLYNADEAAPFEVRAGDRVSQLLVLPIADVEVVETDALEDSERGVRGLGSTGR